MTSGFDRICLLLPTRGRRAAFDAMIDSAMNTAHGPVEVVAYVDDDDSSYDGYDRPGVQIIRGPRIVLSEMWNACYAASDADVVGLLGDDVRFRTSGWDMAVLDGFPEDGIAFVHGDDGSVQDQRCFGTHGFVSRRWVNAVGYFAPPYFSCDYNDTWLNEVSWEIGRHVRVPILTEHMHFGFGKRLKDESDNEREARGGRDNVAQLYKDLAPRRLWDAEKLRAVCFPEYSGR